MMPYLAPEYKEIEKELKSFIDENNLDEVTVNSLIRGSIEVLEPDIPIASSVFINAKTFSHSVSVKVKNIKVNLEFALNSIFAFKSICDATGIGLILVLLRAILSIMGKIQVTLGVKEAVTLFALYRLRCADSERIFSYIKQMSEENANATISRTEMEEALKFLESIGTIKMEDGNYCIQETIIVTNT